MGMQERLDAVIDNALVQKRIVGSVVLVSHKGDPVYSRASGMADRDAGRAVELDTIFRFASLTKPIVAATILAMADEGLLGLEDSITSILPYFTPKLVDGTQPEIKVRHLLSHSAGLTGNISPSREETISEQMLAVNGNYWHLSLEDSMKRLAGMPLLYAPGTGWAYGQALDVLGAAAAQIVGGTLGDAVAKYVTKPLGMVDTGFKVKDTDRLAVAYGNDTPEPAKMDEPHSMTNPSGDVTVFSPGRILDARAYQSGGGGMAGTAPDFMKLLNSLHKSSSPILKASTVAMAMQNQIGDVSQDALKPGQRFGFLGAIIDDPAAAESPQTKGTVAWGGIFGGAWFVDPAEDLCVIGLTNTAFEGCNGAFPDEVRDAVYG